MCIHTEAVCHAVPMPSNARLGREIHSAIAFLCTAQVVNLLASLTRKITTIL